MGLGSFLKSLLGSAEREVETEINKAKRSVEQGLRSSFQPRQQQSQPAPQQRPQPQQPQPQYDEDFPEVPNYTEAQWLDHFRQILNTDFGKYSIRENIPVQELAGDVSDEFQFYANRPQQAYKAEWGYPYTFVFYENGKARGVILLGKSQSQYKHVKLLISKMYAKKMGLPFITFYMDAPNERNYVIQRIHKFLD